MTAFLVAFVIAGLNPFGGMFVAIPLAIFKLAWPAWLAVLLAVPLAYGQVLAVDLLWDRLLAWPAWLAFVEKRRSPKLESLLARRDAAVWLALLSPWIGPWLVTAAARFSGQRQGRIALPLLFGLTYMAAGTALVCLLAPNMLPK